ncbi:HAD-IA family hydrolase [Nocardia sp. NPDC005978]|uniref:HAD-IA family hydrolase n=1 Tax=Nocardia sp. NPDC005978 TaxID=3156725 RepID=UPI0033B6EC9E
MPSRDPRSYRDRASAAPDSAAGSHRPYDAVLCDIDGVLRIWPPADHIERENQLPRGALAASAFAPARLQPAITGEITDGEWRAATAADIAVRFGSRQRAHAAVTAWSNLQPRIDTEAVGLLRAARGNALVALVSNGTTRLEQDLRRQGLHDLPDLLINSARVGLTKPDPRLYLLATERLAVPPRRCLFVDDTEANVAAARSVGMTAVHYRDVEDLRGALAGPPPHL